MTDGSVKFTSELPTNKTIVAIANLELITAILNVLSFLYGEVVLSTLLVISRFSAMLSIIWLTDVSFIHLKYKVLISVLLFIRELHILTSTVLYMRSKRSK